MYKTILADPAWKTCTGGSKSLSPAKHYPVQTKSEVIDTMKGWINQHPVCPEAHLYLWTLNSFSAGKSKGILDGVEVCRALGFKPITTIIWCKPQSNPTPYGQRATEVCIFATRYRQGKGKEVMYRGTQNPENVVSSGLLTSTDWFVADRRQHSRKPDEFYDIVESRSQGPYLEMYSRTSRKGWTPVGNQAGTWKI